MSLRPKSIAFEVNDESPTEPVVLPAREWTDRLVGSPVLGMCVAGGCAAVLALGVLAHGERRPVDVPRVPSAPAIETHAQGETVHHSAKRPSSRRRRKV